MQIKIYNLLVKEGRDNGYIITAPPSVLSELQDPYEGIFFIKNIL